MAGRPDHRSEMKNKTAAFTLVEFAVLLALVGFMSLVLGSGLARTSPATKTTLCLNNNRQLCRAWAMYAADNRNLMPYASDDGTGTSNPLNQYAWVQNHMDFNPNNRGNWDQSYLLSSPLWPYSGQAAGIWKCPSDSSYVLVSGEKRSRIRSMEMNFYLGGFAGTDGGVRSVAPYRLFARTSEFIPSPSRIFVFLDVRPDVVSWPDFFTDMTGYLPVAPAQYQISELPGDLHDGACGFSFADTHVELKRWRDPRTVPRTIAVSPLPTPLASPNNPDVAWLQDHATRGK